MTVVARLVAPLWSGATERTIGPTMDPSLALHLLIYGALMVGAAILGFWPELTRFGQAVHDHTALDQIRRGFALLRHHSTGKP